MKRDAFTHPKTLDLASRLDISRAHAVGILNLLFDFTATYTPQGDIGKHRNGAISRACDWMGSPDEFISALVESGWVDESESHRLVIHDWPDHCEQWVKLKLQKLKIGFLSCYDSAMVIAEPFAEAIAVRTTEASASRDPNLALTLTKPSLANNPPSLAKPSEIDWSVRWSVGVVGKDFVERVVEVANRYTKLKTCKLDREFVWRIAWVGVEFDVDSVNDACDKLRKPGEVAKPQPYLNAIMRKICEKNFEDWERLKKLVPSAPAPVKPIVIVEEEACI